jgi:hypothetical protein
LRWNETTDTWQTTNDGTTYSNIVTVADSGIITSAMIADGAIVNADINNSAAIALSKLASGTSGQIIVANSSGVPTWVSKTGDVTISDTGVTAIASGVIVNADINASAAIDKTKISGTAITAADTGTVTSTMIADSTIVNGDISASAAIAHSKLANATAGQVLLGTTTTGVVTATTVSGDVTITGAGVTAIATGVIVNADINASAAIDKTKISGTAITAADTGTVTSTMIADSTIVNADISASAAIALSKLASGTSGQIVLANSAGVPTYVTLSGDITVSSTGVATIAANSVALGTDTTGNYMSDVTAGTGVTVTHTPSEGSTATIAIGQSVATNANPSFAGVTADAVQLGITAAGEIDTVSGNLTIDSAGGTVTVDDNLIVAGNLTVSGTTTSVNTETLTIDDNIIILNNNEAGTPSQNAGIEVERGTSTNVLIRWNETSDKWEITNDGSTYGSIITTADTGTVTSTMIADGTIANGDISASAAIAHSKLANATAGQVLLGTTTTGVITATTVSGDVTITGGGVTAIASNTIVDADISTAAAISLSKLATSTAGNIIVYNASGVPTAVAETGDVTIDSSGVTSIAAGVIVNADISSSAAIEQSKIADATIDTKTGTYTLALTDKNKFIEMNVGSANDVTVPTNANVAFPIGSQIHITQYGAGKTRVVAQTPATTTIRATPGVFLRAQYASATLIKRGTDEWYLVGDLSAT